MQAQIERNRSDGVRAGAAGGALGERLQPREGDARRRGDVERDPRAQPARSRYRHHASTRSRPRQPAADSAFDVEPIKVQFSGSFYNLSDFLLRLRNLVRVENGKLLARGRMFAVSDIGFSEAEQKFPYVKAVMTVNAFVPAVRSRRRPPTRQGRTTGTTTTQTTTTDSSQSASGAASGGSS